jgi:hypothetical protein
MRLNETGMYIHGSPDFIKQKGSGGGLPQSAGCTRVSTVDAVTIQGYVKIGTVVTITGSFDAFLSTNPAITKLYNKVNGGYRLKVVDDQSPQTRKMTKDALVNGQLLVRWADKKDQGKALVGLPCLPESSWVPLQRMRVLLGE